VWGEFVVAPVLHNLFTLFVAMIGH